MGNFSNPLRLGKGGCADLWRLIDDMVAQMIKSKVGSLMALRRQRRGVLIEITGRLHHGFEEL